MSRENPYPGLSPSTRETSLVCSRSPETVQVAGWPLATALTTLFYFSLLFH